MTLALDLFCSEVLAARGLLAAGFDVIGVDNRPSVARWFPAASRIHIGDWRKITDRLRREGLRPDFVWASPPCQRYSHGTVAGHAHKHPDLIAAVRDYLDDWGVPYVIENVPRAPLVGAVELCGTMFGLEADDPASGRRLYLKRHRLFEASGFTITPPTSCRCREREHAGLICGGVYGGARSDLVEARTIRKGGYTPPAKETRAELMGVNADDFTLHGLSEGIPPRYSRWIAQSWQWARSEAVA